jgi:hypothetical protein
MPRVSAAFFTVGGLCVLSGMLLGMHMGATNDFVLVPLHAHLNLLGWATMALYGTFYALTAQTMSKSLAWLNFSFSAAGIIILAPALAIFLKTNNTAVMPVMITGEVLSVLALLTFLYSALRELARRRPAERAAAE